MTKGVFLHRADSVYDDFPEERYQFPKSYYSRAMQFVGDWIVYKEPERAGRQGYFAVAKVEQIIPDPSKPDMYLAMIEPGSYLPFERNVPFNDRDGVVERGVLNERGVISGRAQAAVRPLSEADFTRIVGRGIPYGEELLPRQGYYGDSEVLDRLKEEDSSFVYDFERDRVSYLVSRPLRDRVFRSRILDAYDRRCALTGFQFINGGGRAEVEAAHIKPVEHAGPDTVRNGLALSGTVHWMFDRGLLSLSDNLEILISSAINDQEGVRKVLNPSLKANEPMESRYRPHPRYLAWHRENRFKL
jgi:putative restriction endonuclease